MDNVTNNNNEDEDKREGGKLPRSEIWKDGKSQPLTSPKLSDMEKNELKLGMWLNRQKQLLKEGKFDKDKDKYDALISLGVEDLRPIKQTGNGNSDDALMKLGTKGPHTTK